MTGYWSLEIDAENAGATWADEPVVVDDNLLTSRVPDDLPTLMGTLVSEVADREAETDRTEPAAPTA